MKLYTKREKTNKQDKKQKILLNGNLPQDVFSKNLSPPYPNSKDPRSVSSSTVKRSFQSDITWQYWMVIVVPRWNKTIIHNYLTPNLQRPTYINK